MTSYYLDTSALIKRYVKETGSNWILKLFQPFLSADNRLNNVASAEGLKIEDPNSHP